MNILIILQQGNNEGSDLVVTMALIIGLLIVWMLLRRMGKRGKRTFRSTSLRNLRQRYLRGEISDEEYERQKKDLTEQN
ncbi:MAG: SHOCT domain-containing protein [Bacteroidales bacterium]|nr:SHOCT domain-containing protein [Bacteroidales bacterium]